MAWYLVSFIIVPWGFEKKTNSLRLGYTWSLLNLIFKLLSSIQFDSGLYWIFHDDYGVVKIHIFYLKNIMVFVR